MIIARSPLRISLGGGGTDLPSYYRKYKGFLIAATINKYVYISLAETFNQKFIIKYSDFEEEKKITNIKHPLFREILLKMNAKTPLNISSHADIPAGTGMGSSGCFAVTLINALSYYQGKQLSNRKIAELACQIEIDKLKEPVGKQDQYTAAFGGLNSYEFLEDESVIIKKIKITKETTKKLKNNLIIFFTGYSRSSYKILQNQDMNTKSSDKLMLNNLHQVKKFGLECKKILENGNLNDFGKIMHEHWQYKKERSKFMSNKKIDYLYNLAIKNGALGGKLIGAGGGGFLMFYSENISAIEKKFSNLGFKKMNFDFEIEGTKIISK
jgi:D-glycero-alpha-D-manno-heptose-7-phosphate kinase